MAKFKMGVTVPAGALVTARMGTTGAKLVDNDKGKFVTLAADSQYNLCAVGTPIEGVFDSLEPATQDGFAIGGVQTSGRISAVCDGLQATPGVGVIAVGEFVRAGTPVAAGTALTTGVAVVSSTDQTTADTAFLWRVVSLGAAGAVGDTCIIERV